MNKRLLVTMVLLVACGVMLAGGRTLAQKGPACADEPNVAVESVQIISPSCGGGGENTCVKVKWNVKTNGAVLSGFTVDLNATPTAPPTTPQNRSVDVGGNVREATLQIFTNSLQGGPFKAQVTAKFQSCVVAAKAGTL